jgi:hypothetical protein
MRPTQQQRTLSSTLRLRRSIECSSSSARSCAGRKPAVRAPGAWAEPASQPARAAAPTASPSPGRCSIQPRRAATPSTPTRTPDTDTITKAQNTLPDAVAADARFRSQEGRQRSSDCSNLGPAYQLITPSCAARGCLGPRAQRPRPPRPRHLWAKQQRSPRSRASRRRALAVSPRLAGATCL